MYYPHSIAIFNGGICHWSKLKNTRWSDRDFDFLCDLQITDEKILLLGTGESLIWLTPEIETYIKSFGLVPEVMSTSSACRTHNVLLSEKRSFISAFVYI